MDAITGNLTGNATCRELRKHPTLRLYPLMIDMPLLQY
jgi:hypothetical protein